MTKTLRRTIQLLTGTDRARVTFALPTKRERARVAVSERSLISQESDIGASIFGPIPQGHRRYFFNLDSLTWIWQEEWHEPLSGQKKSVIVRYEVSGDNILKIDNGRYSYIEGVEYDNFVRAVELYYDRVMRGVYKRDPNTGESLDS